MTVYWNAPGVENTEYTCRLAVERAAELGIEQIVVASNTGYTADFLLHKISNLVVVTHQVGFREPGEDEMGSGKREELTKQGVKIVTASHLFGNVDRAVSNKFGGLYPGGIVAHTLRTFGQGTKVCMEIAVMALDAGAISYGKEVIAIGGSRRGADTAMVLTPEHAKDIFDTQVHELICKPRTGGDKR
ncbi:MAG: hypothetical protein FH749_15565 [Firmicutes bacterium]|nr:hypothetical protein [Bacillota bacterium]